MIYHYVTINEQIELFNHTRTIFKIIYFSFCFELHSKRELILFDYFFFHPRRMHSIKIYSSIMWLYAILINEQLLSMDWCFLSWTFLFYFRYLSSRKFATEAWNECSTTLRFHLVIQFLAFIFFWCCKRCTNKIKISKYSKSKSTAALNKPREIWEWLHSNAIGISWDMRIAQCTTHNRNGWNWVEIAKIIP